MGMEIEPVFPNRPAITGGASISRRVGKPVKLRIEFFVTSPCELPASPAIRIACFSPGASEALRDTYPNVNPE
jgi:hypothetical protein